MHLRQSQPATQTDQHTQQRVIHTWEGVGSQKCLGSDVTYTRAQDPNLELFDSDLFFMPPPPLSRYLFPHRNTFMWLYLHQISLSTVFVLSGDAPSPVTANKVTSTLFIISNNRAITQVSIWAAALYESRPALAVWRAWSSLGTFI